MERSDGRVSGDGGQDSAPVPSARTCHLRWLREQIGDDAHAVVVRQARSVPSTTTVSCGRLRSVPLAPIRHHLRARR